MSAAWFSAIVAGYAAIVSTAVAVRLFLRGRLRLNVSFETLGDELVIGVTNRSSVRMYIFLFGLGTNPREPDFHVQSLDLRVEPGNEFPLTPLEPLARMHRKIGKGPLRSAVEHGRRWVIVVDSTGRQHDERITDDLIRSILGGIPPPKKPQSRSEVII